MDNSRFLNWIIEQSFAVMIADLEIITITAAFKLLFHHFIIINDNRTKSYQGSGFQIILFT